jgi:hypothetical protein
MLVRMPPAAEAVRRSFEELSNTTQSMGALRRSDQTSTGTGGWARHSIKNTWPNRSGSTKLI